MSWKILMNHQKVIQCLMARAKILSKVKGNRYSNIFFCKSKSYQSLNESAIDDMNAHDTMESVCQGLSSVYNGGTFYIHNQYPLMKVKHPRLQKIQKLHTTYKMSKRCGNV